MPPSFLCLESENATGGKTLDSADTNDVTKAGGTEKGSVTHAAEKCSIR